MLFSSFQIKFQQIYFR